MKKNLLFRKLGSCKIPLMVLLLAMCTFYTAFAQTRQITGKVTSGDDGSALPGVSVKLKGTNLGTVTDVNGVFRISAASGNVLTFSYIGFDARDVVIGGESAYSVSLTPNARALAEVNVVSIGYGTAKRTDLTGSIGSISAATIAKAPVTSADQALQGRVAGVQVTNNDASPGGNISVLVRGVGSLASNGNGPLYVIDGYPLSTGGLNNINPNDIASIDVLKDASATAIYGIRAANGVVIITTKHGKKDGAQVEFSAYNAFQSKPKEYKVLNAQQFATLYNTVKNDASQSIHIPDFPPFDNPSALHNIDWQNVIYRPGLTQSYNLAIRAGSDKVQTATSIGFYQQKGIVYASYFKRLTLNSNADYQPVKWLRSSTNFKYAWQEGKNPIGGQLQNGGNLLQISELPPTLDGGNMFTNQPKDANGNYGFYNPNTTQLKSYGNPLYNADHNTSNNLDNFFLINTSLEAQLIDGLKVKTNVGVDMTAHSGEFFNPSDRREADQYPGTQIQNPLYGQNINQTFDWLWENTISYDKTFGKHAINIVGGVSEQKTMWSGMNGSGIPPNSTIQDLAQVTQLQLQTNGIGQNNGNGGNISTLQSYFGRATYKFEDRYILTGTIRRDGSSKFPTANQYGTFPSGAIAWKAKQESFLKNVSWLSDLKFRGSYGLTGNQGPILPFQYLQLYGGNFPATSNGGGVDNFGYPFNKIYQPGIASLQPSNPKLKWETDYQTDIGVDAAFLNGDLTITADWFNRKSKDFLLNLANAAQSGYLFETRNVGSMDNKGLEFAINYNHKANSDFQYGVSLTLATVDNKLTSITSGVDFVQNFGGLTPVGDGWNPFSETHVGQPVGEFWGYKSLGILQSQAQINQLDAIASQKQNIVNHIPGVPDKTYHYGLNGNALSPGDRYFADLNGDGIVNANDETSLGSPLPKFYGGLNFDASYKAWDFNAYFYGVYGNKIFDNAESALESFQNRNFVGVENVSLDYYNNYWTPTRPSNIYARAVANDDNLQNDGPSSAFIQNGSFLKLKNFTVGYTLPGAFARKIAVTKLRVYVSTQNLFTITSYKGLDPEIGIQGGNPTQNGVDTGTYPSSKFYTIGLNVTL